VLAAVVADVDVAVDHVGHRFADQLGPQPVSVVPQLLACWLGLVVLQPGLQGQQAGNITAFGELKGG
jgi:hypothetical protein